MKKTSTILLAILLVVGLSNFLSCKKADTLSDNQRELSEKLNTWFDLQKNNLQKQGVSHAKIANIDLLKQNLELQKYTRAELNDNIHILNIPINDVIVEQKKLDKESSLMLLVYMDKSERVLSQVLFTSSQTIIKSILTFQKIILSIS